MRPAIREGERERELLKAFGLWFFFFFEREREREEIEKRVKSRGKDGEKGIYQSGGTWGEGRPERGRNAHSCAHMPCDPLFLSLHVNLSLSKKLSLSPSKTTF